MLPSSNNGMPFVTNRGSSASPSGPLYSSLGESNLLLGSGTNLNLPTTNNFNPAIVSTSNTPIFSSTTSNAGQINGNASTLPSKNKSFLNQTKTTLFRFIKYFTLLVVFLNAVTVGFRTFQVRELFSSGVVNTICSRHTISKEKDGDVSPLSNFEYNPIIEKICGGLPPTQQFTKFLWFVSDGLPVQYSQKIFKHYEDHLVLFPIDLPGPKYSHAIYTSYLTGQLPTNYKGHPIKGDNLLKSIKRSPDIGPTTYIGPHWSFLAIAGTEQDYPKMFDKIDIQEEPLDQPHDRAYRFFFKDQPTKQKFFGETLENLKNTGGSMVTHSAIFDHINHGVYRTEPVQTYWLDQLADRIAEDFNSLKDWIDRNPEYLLIMSSDHGCDDVSNGYVLHGYSTNGNEGYVSFYNPTLLKHKQKIDVVDVAATIAKYLKNVDIPADNIGFTRSIFAGDKRYENRASAVKQNLIQLCDTTKRRGLIAGCSISQINALLEMDVSDQNRALATEQLQSLESTASKMKEQLYSFVYTPWNWVIFYLSISLVIAVYIFARFNKALIKSIFTQSIWNIGKFAILPMMYYGLYINFLFYQESWKDVFLTGNTFIVYQGFLTLVVLYLFIAYVLRSYHSESKTDLPTNEKSGHVVKLLEAEAMESTGIHRFFYNAAIDMFLFCLHTLFAKQWKPLVQSALMSFVPYILMFFFIAQVYKVKLSNLILLPIRVCMGKRNNDTVIFAKKNAKEFIFALILYIMIIAFELTSALRSDKQEIKDAYMKYYFVFDFHFIYFAFMVCSLLYIIYCLFFSQDEADKTSQTFKLVIPATLYAFALMRDTPHQRFNTLLFNMQYLEFIAPFVMSVCNLESYNQHLQNDKARGSRNPKTSSMTVYLSLFAQAAVLYVLNHLLFWFVTGREEKFNIDAHPFAGGVGMRSHQAHPSFNAFQMAYEKWHYLLLFCVYIHYGILKSRSTKEDSKKVQHSNVVSSSQGHHVITDLFFSEMVLYVFNAHWFLQLLLCVIGMNHAFEEPVVYLIVTSAIGALFAFLFLTDVWKKSSLMKQCRALCFRQVKQGKSSSNSTSPSSATSFLPTIHSGKTNLE